MIDKNTPTAFVLSMPVDELDIPPRAWMCFMMEHIITIGDLVEQSERDLLKIKNFGRISLSLVKKRLSEHNLKLREETIVERVKRMGIKYIIQ